MLAPEFLFMLINKRCNLRCQHCNFWKLDDDDRPRYLSRERRREVLQEFSQMRPDGKVVICGGESMLDLEDYFDISSTSRALGLRCLSVINGTRVRERERAERMIREGPHEISVSLNSHRAELHDRTRGVQHGATVDVEKKIPVLVRRLVNRLPHAEPARDVAEDVYSSMSCERRVRDCVGT